jgi:hypothetical protein
MMEGVNSTMIYYTNFCRFNNVPQDNNNFKKDKKGFWNIRQPELRF